MNRRIHSLRASANLLFRQLVLRFRWSHLRALAWYLRDWSRLRSGHNPRFGELILYPCLDDRTSGTPLDPTYFYQDTWAAAKVFRQRPAHHVDIGSSAMTVGILSQFVPTTMIDIRPIALTLPGLEFRQGSILETGLPSQSVESLSSLCVVEHIGLGRYGDPLDAFGSEKAAAELSRIVAVGGNLYVSLPVDDACRVYFNAHRAFTRNAVLELFPDLVLIEEKYQYGDSCLDAYDPTLGFGTGMFHFIREVPNVQANR